MLVIPQHLIGKEDIIQNLLIKAQQKTEEYKYSDYKFENEYYEALFEYVDEVMKKIGEGISLELDVEPLQKSRKVPVQDLIKISNGDDDMCLLHKSLFTKLKKKYTYYKDFLKRFNFNKGKKLEPIKFKNKIKYNPITKKPLKKKEWNNLTNDIVEFLGDKIGTVEEEVVVRGALFGKLIRSMEKEKMTESQIKNMSYSQLEKKFGKIPQKSVDARKKFHFKDKEKQALDWAENNASEYLSIKDGKLRNTIVTDTRQTIASGIKDGLSPEQLASELYWATPEKRKKKAAGHEKYKNPNEWALNFRRIALTESKTAKSNGYLLAKKMEDPKKKTYFVYAGRNNPQEKADESCNKYLGKVFLLVDEPRDSEIVKKKEDQFADYYIWPGKTNIGRKTANHWGCIPTHPNCTHYWLAVDPQVMEFDSSINKLVFKDV